LGVQPEKIS